MHAVRTSAFPGGSMGTRTPDDVRNPVGPSTGFDVVRRGPNRVANRGFGLPHFSFRFFGLRVARSVED